MNDMRVLPADDGMNLKLGWVIYEELWPIANDTPGFDSYWFDGSREKLNLRIEIVNRVSDLLKEERKVGLSEDRRFEMIYLCRDQCETKEDVEKWEIPIEN